jgi:hypothetical protein
MAPAPVLYLQGEIEVSVAGKIRIQLDSPQGIRLWVDGQPAPSGAPAFEAAVGAGRHSITLRVENKARASREIRVEIAKPHGSHAEFTVVGGR